MSGMGRVEGGGWRERVKNVIVAACHSERRPCFSTLAACVNAFYVTWE